jgi:hypothetical protein
MLDLLIYSWNTQASFFDEQSSDILSDIDARITPEVQLIVVALQEAVKPGSQFISLILPNHLRSQGFEQLHRSRLMGVGVTTYKSIQRFDLRLRGLRLALYARKSWLLVQESVPTIEENYCYCSGIYQWSLGKGALSFTLKLPGNLGRLRLINLHLPFSAASLNAQDNNVRDAAIAVQTQAFNDIVEQLSAQDPCEFTFFIGDLNYRVRLTAGESVDCLDLTNPYTLYLERDELLNELSKFPAVLPALKEGIANRGPEFPPTAKLLQKTGGLYNFGKQNRRAPSWCDRVLYLPCSNLTCKTYERLDPNSATSNSDHAAVSALFTLNERV